MEMTNDPLKKEGFNMKNRKCAVKMVYETDFWDSLVRNLLGLSFIAILLSVSVAMACIAFSIIRYTFLGA